jgi:hypothetical protein
VGANFGDVSNCYSNGTVNGTNDVGGLLGINNQYTVGDANSIGIVAMSYSTGPVTGVDRVGGLAGSNLSELHTSYSRSTVDGDTDVGGLVGSNGGGLFGHVGITDSYWDIEASGEPNMCGFQSDFAVGCDNSYGKTTAEMKQQSTFDGWDFVDETENGPNDVWKIVEGQTYPLLSWQKYGGGTGEPNHPYLIYTAEHLNEMSDEPNDWDKHFKLMADIDLSGYLYDRAVIACDTNDASWEFEGTPFTGVFNGNGHTISHMTMTGRNYIGLLGKLGEAGMISNLGLETVDVNGIGIFVGGLVARNSGSITTSHISGTVTGGFLDVGGLVGRNSGSITASHSTGLVVSTGENWIWGSSTAPHNRVGGLVGLNSGFIIESYSSSTTQGFNGVGGLVGYNTEDGCVTACYSTGPVSGAIQVGGLVGCNVGRIGASYSSGMVHGDTVGGLVGTNSVTQGEMDVVTTYGVIASSFWDIETSGQVISDGGESKTTVEMQTATTFLEAGWDFIEEDENGTDDIWWIDEGNDYPRLRWELIP